MSNRLKSKKYPPGIDARKLPANVNFHSARKIWYVSFFKDGIRKTKKIAGFDATMADIWEAVKKPNENTVSFQWLANKFKESSQFKKLEKSTQKGHLNTWRILSEQPTRSGLLSDTNRYKWDQPLVQKVIDKIAKETPTTAVRAKQNLSRLFNWGINRGYMAINPATNIETPKLDPKRKMPTKAVLERLIIRAQKGAQRQPHTKGSIPSVIWKSLEIARMNRLRGIETRLLTDADILEDGLLCERTKGSKANVTLWSNTLRTVIDACLKDRAAVWAKKRHPYPFRPEDRPLLVNNSGDALTSSGWQSIWGNFMENAVADGIIEPGEKFGLHAMKRRGVTDTKKGESKQEAAGFKSERMVDVYDQSIPRVNTPD
tara:strand:- start:306 stop:1424 length:1119 start_codon:yes stop_codon:yes gene_type:complete